jgi:hypothetical protein
VSLLKIEKDLVEHQSYSLCLTREMQRGMRIDKNSARLKLFSYLFQLGVFIVAPLSALLQIWSTNIDTLTDMELTQDPGG